MHLTQQQTNQKKDPKAIGDGVKEEVYCMKQTNVKQQPARQLVSPTLRIRRTQRRKSLSTTPFSWQAIIRMRILIWIKLVRCHIKFNSLTKLSCFFQRHAAYSPVNYCLNRLIQTFRNSFCAVFFNQYFNHTHRLNYLFSFRNYFTQHCV